MTSFRTPATLVIGATGAGKTTYIAGMLRERPPNERWAVLVNDFGRVSLLDTPGVSQGAVTVREVAGCICCSAQVAMRTAIVALLRKERPARLLIEASAAAHPHAIADVLLEPGIAAAVALERTVCVVDPRQATDERYTGTALYREQVKAADAVLLRYAEPAQSSAARAALAALGSAPIADA